MANAASSADEECRSSSSASDDGDIFEDALDFEDHDAPAVGSGSESESDDDDDRPAVEHHKPSEKRQQQTAYFQSWFSKRVQSLVKEDQHQLRTQIDEDRDSKSILFAKGEAGGIISDPREYQLELFERAKTKNTIAVLDTGSGKTLIAVLLLRFVLDQELEDRAQGKDPKIAFFLVDSVTLVFQQHAVLDCNLDQKMDRFCGDMGCDLWTKQIWDKHIQDNMVIVCTADVLYQALMHSFVRISQINLLIFDEAHHAKKNHAYARIMKDFYIAEENVSRRPRVFGMTASPVDSREDVVKAAKELETLLQCQIATTSDMNLLRQCVHRASEEVIMYDRLPLPHDTPLCHALRSSFGDIEILAKYFRHAHAAASELGPWCADHVWTFLINEIDAQKVEAKLEMEILKRKGDRLSLEATNEEVSRLRQAVVAIQQHCFEKLCFASTHLSSKVLLLYHFLRKAFGLPTNDRCIVFVKKRYTARVLGHIFSRAEIPYIRVGILLGARTGDAGDPGLSYRQQIVTLTQFRKGTLNCLFATSVAEEGLDIPDCNLVIRFDLYSTMIQYLQSRGRARRSGSKYLHMLEHGNPAQLSMLHEVHKGEGVLREFCQSLPADRRLLGNDCDYDGLLLKERSHQVFTESTTGAKLTYASSLAVLAHFVNSLPRDGEAAANANYVITSCNGQFVCEVILPENSPIHSAIGRPAARKSVAKRSAAFEACLALRKGKYLDANLLPIYQKQLPAMRNAHLALTAKNTQAYDMRTKPSIWAKSVGPMPEELFMTVIHLAEHDPSRPLQPLALLMRSRLPHIPTFPVYLSAGLKTDAICTTLRNCFQLSVDQAEALDTFTRRFFKDIFNKTYEVNPERMPYFLAPVRVGCVISVDTASDDVIDWATLHNVQQRESLPWNETTSHDFFMDKFVVDPYDGGRRYFTVGVDPDLKPLDPVPAGAPIRKNMENILDYSISLFKKSRARVVYRTDQPVILAHRVLHRRNWLDEITAEEQLDTTECYICLEPLQVSLLPTAIAAMGLIFPAIIFRIDSYLVALELFQNLGLSVQAELALEAVTKDSDNTEEHRGEQLVFQRGMGKNYERLELLGDSFLKMATSISLFTLQADADEFEYHVSRMLLVCNKNLLKTAKKLKIYEYIRSKSFSRRVWYPEEPRLLQGKGFNKSAGTQTHNLNDKTMADVCEAIIGAALLCGENQSQQHDNAVKAVTLMVDSSNHLMKGWADYYACYKLPVYQTAPANQSQLDLAAQLEAKHPYHFRYPRLLRSAFTHPSYPFSWEKIPCYQRLEFLGDALLDMACVNFLFHRFPDRDPQWLTEHKMAMVSNKFLGALSVRLGFHKHLRFNGSLVQSQIRDYVTEIGAAEEEAKGAVDYWVHVKSPPKCLPDIVEAYVAAVFVDAEYDYGEVERFFDMHIKWYFEDMSIYDTYANNHPMTFLTNLLFNHLGCTNFRILAREIPPLTPSAAPQVLAAVVLHDAVIAEGQAASGKNARVRASSNALKLLQTHTPASFRRQYGCNCRADGLTGAPPVAGGEGGGGGGGGDGHVGERSRNKANSSNENDGGGSVADVLGGLGMAAI